MQVAGLLTVVLVTDPEIALSPCELCPASSTVFQGTQEESRLLIPQVTGPQTLVLAVDLETTC